MKYPGRALAALLLCCVTGTAAAIDEASLRQCAAVGDAAARLACYDALAAGAAAPVATPAEADFGKPAAPQPEPSLQARVVGTFREWQPGTLFKLDNGQTWRVTGEDSGYYPNVPESPEVIITKSWFGSYRMKILAIGREIKVKRIS